MNSKVATILYIGFMIFVVVGMIFLFIFLKSKSFECINNPYIYGAKQMGNVECRCVQSDDEFMIPATFYFNSTTFIIDDKNSQKMIITNLTIME